MVRLCWFLCKMLVFFGDYIDGFGVFVFDVIFLLKDCLFCDGDDVVDDFGDGCVYGNVVLCVVDV